MAKYSLAIDNLVKDLRNAGPFEKEAIRSFYKKRGENLSDNLLAVRINRLKKLEVLAPVAKGLYEINAKRSFYPVFSTYIMELHTKLTDQYPMAEMIFWETAWLNEFSVLQIVNNWIIIEVESVAEESVFETAHGLEPSRTFLNPGEKELELYLPRKENPIIVKALLTGSPRTTVNEMVIPKLEKIIIDLYFDKFLDKIFKAERTNILTEAVKGYRLNFTTMLNYAARRGKKEEMTDILKQNVDNIGRILDKPFHS